MSFEENAQINKIVVEKETRFGQILRKFGAFVVVRISGFIEIPSKCNKVFHNWTKFWCKELYTNMNSTNHSLNFSDVTKILEMSNLSQQYMAHIEYIYLFLSRFFIAIRLYVLNCHKSRWCYKCFHFVHLVAQETINSKRFVMSMWTAPTVVRINYSSTAQITNVTLTCFSWARTVFSIHFPWKTYNSMSLCRKVFIYFIFLFSFTVNSAKALHIR